MSQSAFDAVAQRYDETFTDTKIGGLQRAAVHSYLDRHVFGRDPLTILELGCGTGEDAVRFAESGHSVTATDLSPSMLAATLEKMKGSQSTQQIQTMPLDLRAPDECHLEGPFDLVFSNFGALNCIDGDALGRLSQFLARLTHRGTHVVLVVMPRTCLWESLYFLLRGQPRSAFRRMNTGPVSAALGKESVSTWYHSPRSISRAFKQRFRRRKTLPIGFAVPPSFLEPWANRNPRILRTLASFDRGLGTFGPLAPISDHALIHLERT